MPAAARKITEADIVPMAQYAKERAERRRALLPTKKLRRVEVGPYATFYFESFETMLLQVQEMLYIEKGGPEQLADELRAYNPLIPQGSELIATVMFEIDDPIRRKNILQRLTGVEETIFLDIGGVRIKAQSETEVDRTDEDGKTSSIHFVRFAIPDAVKARFRDSATAITIGFNHENYGHLAMLQPATRAELAKDFG